MRTLPHPGLLVTMLLVLIGSSRIFAATESLDLSGRWNFALDPQDQGLSSGPETWRFPDSINLPGTTAAQGKGDPLQIALNLEKPAMQHLHQRHPYIGPAWYQRDITIPPGWANRDLILTLERVLWESRVWIDQQPVAEPQHSLSTPHRYDLTRFLTPGRTHTLTLRIDNRQIVDIGTIGHAYTQETQTIWNGVIGKLKIDALPQVRTERVQVRPQADLATLSIDLDLLNTGAPVQANLALEIKPHGGKRTIPVANTPIFLPSGSTHHSLDLSKLNSGIPTWSEFDPTLHELSVVLTSPGSSHTRRQDFGVRTIKTDGKVLLINNLPSFLRGNLECAIFPATGHPDADGEQWNKIMRSSREWGLNHLRFHSWCPPEAAFAAADRHGIYLQVELPNWTFKMGQNPSTDQFLKTEGERILREFGHHPSFVLFSLGNELKGSLPAMDSLLAHFRSLAPDLLYTSTSYAFSPRGRLPGPNDDFFISQQTQSGWVRGQGFLNTTFPSTDTDYVEGLKCLSIPLITHEVGQYVVYPNLAEIPKFENSPMRPTALEAIKADLLEKGLLADATRFTRDSGKLAALLYKEDIERALRTKDLAGIQLLQLQDFPGQSTATVGLLDAFWDSKGLIKAERFREFTAPVVPLARFRKFVWKNDETFAADLELANFGPTPLESSFRARILNEDGETVHEQMFTPQSYPLGNSIPIGRIEAPLDSCLTATKLTLEVSAPGSTIQNSWPLWIYPATLSSPQDSDLVTHFSATEACLADLAAGKTVLLLPPAGALKKRLPARFIPVFWSPLHFPNQPGTLGATIDHDHPLWEQFPTDTHTNWQWWELTADSASLDLSGLDPAISKPFRFIDKFNRNALPAAIFETRVGPGKLLVCTLDVNTDLETRFVARQLRHALQSYADSTAFAPAGRLSPEDLQSLINASALAISASNSHPSYPVISATDGDPGTFWHTDWTKPADGPATVTLDLQQQQPIRGLRITARPDMSNGRIATCRIEVSENGTDWIKTGPIQRLPDSSEPTDLLFEKPRFARYLRLTALRAHKAGNNASLAEIAPLLSTPKDVRDLGIVPGFND